MHTMFSFTNTRVLESSGGKFHEAFVFVVGPSARMHHRLRRMVGLAHVANVALHTLVRRPVRLRMGHS